MGAPPEHCHPVVNEHGGDQERLGGVAGAECGGVWERHGRAFPHRTSAFSRPEDPPIRTSMHSGIRAIAAITASTSRRRPPAMPYARADHLTSSRAAGTFPRRDIERIWGFVGNRMPSRAVREQQCDEQETPDRRPSSPRTPAGRRSHNTRTVDRSTASRGRAQPAPRTETTSAVLASPRSAPSAPSPCAQTPCRTAAHPAVRASVTACIGGGCGSFEGKGWVGRCTWGGPVSPALDHRAALSRCSSHSRYQLRKV